MNTSLLSGAEVSTYGEEPDRPDWFQRIGWTLVGLGLLFYAWMALT